MTTMTHTNGARPADAGFLEPIVRPFADLAARIRRYNEYARAESQLRELSDHELADIGLTRDVIHERVWADFPQT